jgi:cytochrome c oxidase assembly factor CtaG
VCLAAGVTVAVVAVSPPLDAVADGSLSAHMVQHLALTMLAAPLIALGAPVATALRLAPPAWRRPAVRALHGRALSLAGGALIAWLAYAAAIWVFHFSRLFDEAAANEWLHAAEHLTFLVTAVLFWRPAVGRDPLVRLPPLRRILYLMAAMPAMDVVGVWLMSSRGVEYPAYGTAPGALAAQHEAGMIMLAGSYPLAVAALLTAWSWIASEQRRADLTERLERRHA